MALVSDAGTPGISDPGYRLITLAIRHKIPVVPIPGPSAFLLALTASGLPTDSFQFSGFLASKRGQRRTELEAIKDLHSTQIFYEAPHRIVETLEDVAEVMGPQRRIVDDDLIGSGCETGRIVDRSDVDTDGSINRARELADSGRFPNWREVAEARRRLH